MSDFNLSPQARALWAKKDWYHNKVKWLPLYVHLSDTARVMDWLLDFWVAPGVIKNLSKDWLAEANVHHFLVWLAAVHDLGKAIPAFQGQPARKQGTGFDKAIANHFVQAGWTSFSTWQVLRSSSSRHELAAEYLLHQRGVSTSVLALIGAHHGTPTSSETIINNQESFHSNYDKGQPELWHQVQQELIDYSLQLAGYQKLADLPTTVPLDKALLIEGLLVMADWVASSEASRTGSIFPLTELNQTDFDLVDRAHHGIAAWKKMGVEGYVPMDDPTPETLFHRRFGFEPHQVQVEMVAKLALVKNPGLVVIESMPGSGKTETALVTAEQLMAKTGRNGLLFALPTQATTDAMFNRVTDWLKAFADEAGTTLPITLRHGKAQFNKTFRNLPSASEDGTDLNDLVITTQWFTKKISLLSPFVVSTIDQVLGMALKQAHVFLREIGIDNKVLILDEVHSFDAYMNQYLARALEWCGRWQIPVILLSATLPASIRKALVDAYLTGRQGKEVDVHLKATGYPRLTYTNANQVIEASHFTQSTAVSVTVTKQVWSNDVDFARQLIKEAREVGGVTDIILNTVKAAQNLVRAITKQAPDVKLLLLHARLVAPDRHDREIKLQSLVGKKGKRPKQLLVIGTQVLEQSLDIDFDHLYTELAPIDLLLQRIGRLHRHTNRQRPTEFAKPQVTILIPSEDLASGGQRVYTQYLLELTKRVLPDRITLPVDIVSLVEAVYCKTDPLDSKIIGAEQFRQRREAAESKANYYRLAGPPKDIPIDPIIAKYSQDASLQETTLIGLLNENAPDGENGNRQVRDSDATIEVIPLWQTPTGLETYGNQPLSKQEPYDIAQSTLSLPNAVTKNNFNDVIQTLKAMRARWVADWQNQPWLKNQLPLVFNLDGHVKLGHYDCYYDSTVGLIIEYQNDQKGG